MTGRTLVVGLGNPDRGDDAVGPAVADAVRGLLPDAATVVVADGPLALLDVWDGYDDVVVVDAVRSGRPPGSIVVIDAVATTLPTESTGAGTHAFGLEAVVELARALRRLPPRLVLVGVESAEFDRGTPMSLEVTAAVADAAGAVTDIVSAAVEDGV